MMEAKRQVFLTAGTACAKAGALEAGCGRRVRRGVGDAGGQTTQALIGRMIKGPTCLLPLPKVSQFGSSISQPPLLWNTFGNLGLLS